EWRLSRSRCVAGRPRTLVVFFFSSRRRHTRFSRDWSSDVCSSDLRDLALAEFTLATWESVCLTFFGHVETRLVGRVAVAGRLIQIGRASCRESVYVPEAAGPSREKDAGTRGGQRRRNRPNRRRTYS